MAKIYKFTYDEFARNWVILILDIGVSVMSSLVAILLVRWVSEPFYEFKNYVILWLAVSFLASMAGFYLFKTYRIVIRYSNLSSVSKITRAVLFKMGILAACTFLGLFGNSYVRFNIIVLILDMLFSVFMLIFTRTVILYILNVASNSVENRIGKVRIMVYGVSNKTIAAVTRLSESTHYDVIGFLSTNSTYKNQILQNKKVYCYSDPQSLNDLRNKLGFECVLVSDSLEKDESQELNNLCMDLGIHVLNIPKIEDSTYGHLTQEALKEISRDSSYIPDGMNSIERNTKRVIDFIISSICLVVFSPLFLIVYIAIKMEDGGPAIYKQERVGRFGRTFNIYKFRSMRVDAEIAGPTLYSGENDPRLTKVGRFIRAHHLDELPQLFNVFVGDMAFIGWRPERQYYIDQIMEVDPRYYYLYQIRPGVTSYATLYNGYTDTLEKMLKRLEYDLFYLRNRSWGFDIKILFMTFMSIVFGKKF